MTSCRRLVILVVIVAATLGTSCGGGNDDAGPPPGLTPAARAGWETARAKGCTSCHGVDGGGGTGPAWRGIAGSVRPLDDGTTVVADRAYLVRSIVEPQFDQVAGYNIRMPLVELTETEVASIVAYLEELT